MKVIGLTGGIGSGKSTVSRFLAELGAVIIDVDKVGHEVFRPGTDVWREVVSAFGKCILAPDDTIDRQRLGEIVFKDDLARRRLNQIMHPRMFELVKTELEEHRRKGTAVVVIEAPLLIEANWLPLVDEVWVTVAPEATILRRLQERSGLSEPEGRARIASQLSLSERTRYADVIIETDCPLDELRARVKQHWERLTERT